MTTRNAVQALQDRAREIQQQIDAVEKRLLQGRDEFEATKRQLWQLHAERDEFRNAIATLGSPLLKAR